VGRKIEIIQLPTYNGGLDKTGVVVAAIELVVAWLQGDVTKFIMTFSTHENYWPESNTTESEIIAT
jgi:hypothetical protein